MNVLLICNDCYSHGMLDDITSYGARNTVETTLRPDVESMRHSSKQLRETIKNFEAAAVQKIEQQKPAYRCKRNRKDRPIPYLFEL